MKRLFILFLLLRGVVALAQSDTSGGDFFGRADVFFNKYVDNGKVDYLSLYADPDELYALVKYMEEEDLKDKSSGYQKAFWMNAYNLTVIKSIVQKKDLESPKDDRQFFSGEKHQVAGQLLTLDEIEHQM